MLTVAFFTLSGIILIVRAYRGRSIACDPACAACGYDLRGYAKLTRCSECGSDLTLPRGVRRNTFRINRRSMLVGLGLMALPWLFIAFAALQSFAGPHWERLRSNRSLIAEIDTVDNQGPWVWAELARRLTAGTLTKTQISAAVDNVVAFIRHKHTGGLLFGSDPFFLAAEKAGGITPSQYLAMGQAFYPGPLRVGFQTAIPSESQSYFYIQSDIPWNLPGLHREFIIQEISMTGASASPESIQHRAGQGTMLPPNINLLTSSPYRTSAPMVAVGKYQVKFVVQTGLFPGGGMMGSAPVSTLSNAGPPALAQWSQTITLPVQVTRTGAIINGIRVPMAIRTDDTADPSRVMSIVSAEALCYTDVTLVIFHLKVNHVPIWCSSMRKIIVNGKSYSAGQQFISPDSPPFEDVFSCEITPPLKGDITADVALDPDFNMADKAYLDQMWGKTISFKAINVHRRECAFSLTKWRAEQHARDIK